MKIDLDQLVTTLKAEEANASSYHASDLAKVQEKALKQFFAEPYGDEHPQRSKTVVHTTEDTINAIMPDLMRTFRGGEEIVSLKSSNAMADQPGQDGRSPLDLQAAYLEHVFFSDNPGLQLIYDLAFDGLLMRLGVIRCAWDEPEAGPELDLKAVSPEQLTRVLNEPEIEITAQDETQAGFDLKIRRKPAMGRVNIEVVPPEEFAIAKGAKTLETASYFRRKSRVYLATLKRDFPKSTAALDKVTNRDGDDTKDDGRAVTRDPDARDVTNASDVGREMVDLYEEFLRIDFDDDGIVELRSIKRVADVILENEAVERSCYRVWTPNRVSHRLTGRSVADHLSDLQRIMTVITRGYLDGLGQTITPKTYVNVEALSKEHGTLDALVKNEVGALVPVKGDVRMAIHESVTPDVSGPALNALEHFDQKSEQSSGVTRQAQGMDPAAMNKTATGIDLLQAAAKTRIELIATWLGNALEGVFDDIAYLLRSHQDRPRQVRLFGQVADVDPSQWSEDATASVHVGSAGVSKAQRVANLMMIAQKQESILLQAPGNPLVKLQHLRATYAALCISLGFKDVGKFFGEIPGDWEPPPPPPDPKVATEQAKLQLAQQKAESDAALAKQIADNKIQLAVSEAEAKHSLALQKAAAEKELALTQMRAEFALERMQMEQRAKLESEKARMMADAAGAKTNGKADTDMPDHRPGGRLDA